MSARSVLACSTFPTEIVSKNNPAGGRTPDRPHLNATDLWNGPEERMQKPDHPLGIIQTFTHMGNFMSSNQPSSSDTTKFICQARVEILHDRNHDSCTPMSFERASFLAHFLTTDKNLGSSICPSCPSPFGALNPQSPIGRWRFCIFCFYRSILTSKSLGANMRERCLLCSKLERSHQTSSTTFFCYWQR